MEKKTYETPAVEVIDLPSVPRLLMAVRGSLTVTPLTTPLTSDNNGVLTARPPHTDGSSATSPKNPARCWVFFFALFCKKSFFYNICNIM